MGTLVRKELEKWKDSLGDEQLDEYDITVANLILNHSDELEKAGGTNYGKRITKFAEIVKDKDMQCDTELINVSARNVAEKRKIKKIKSMSVNSFRGFAEKRDFNLDKQYVFMYGPNGSGKTSFSEALEYGLIGSISEADANKISLNTYIKNTTTNIGESPEIKCIYEDGTTGNATSDYEAYRFAFVEKNRITDFSHISSLDSRSQTERLAALFGLSEFTSFVKGFSKICEEKYLPIKSQTEEQYKIDKIERDTKEKDVANWNIKLSELQKEADKKVIEVAKKNSSVKTLDNAIDYYDNSENGVYIKKLQNQDKETIKLVDYSEYEKLKDYIKEIRANLDSIKDRRGDLANNALQVNYKNLYDAVLKLGQEDTCPLCGTLIINAKRNPYEYAKAEISKFKTLDTIEKEIKSSAEECKHTMDELKNILDNNQKLLDLIGINTKDLASVSATDIEKMEDNTLKPWTSLVDSIIEQNDEDIADKIDSYNKDAQVKNDKNKKELVELKNKRDKLVHLKEQIDARNKQIREANNYISDFDERSESTLEIIETEKKQAAYNAKIIAAYQKVIKNLYDYKDKLPEQIAMDLEEKIVDYYNVINKGDAEFEMLESISLPVVNNNQIMITFKDGKTDNALHVLSEGHVKILGLSILLAKAVKDNLHFIVFDDIVNAIDDEHRKGVAELLMQHEDFADIQIILSSHGQNFITTLKDKLGQSECSRHAVIYRFLPADSLRERGVIVEYSDASTSLEAARRYLDNDNLKDAAFKCRQSLECISYSLWNKLAKKGDGYISVSMKSPQALPDLSSIISALKKKSNEIAGMEPIRNNLEIIQENSNWNVLNKGTHFEYDQSEFHREDVIEVLDTVTELDNQTRGIRLQLTASFN